MVCEVLHFEAQYALWLRSLVAVNKIIKILRVRLNGLKDFTHFYAFSIDFFMVLLYLMSIPLLLKESNFASLFSEETTFYCSQMLTNGMHKFLVNNHAVEVTVGSISDHFIY